MGGAVTADGKYLWTVSAGFNDNDIRIVDTEAPEPGDGEILLHVSHSALTANNVTYGAFGDVMGYWNFFPTAGGWGRVPVWGFADVEVSKAPGITDGELLNGVRFDPKGASTQTLVMRSRSGTVRLISARHRLDKLRDYAVVDYA